MKRSILISFIIGCLTIIVFYIKNIYGKPSNNDSNNMGATLECPYSIRSFIEAYETETYGVVDSKLLNNYSIGCSPDYSTSGDTYFIITNQPDQSNTSKGNIIWDWVRKSDNSYLAVNDKEGKWYNAGLSISTANGGRLYHLSFFKMDNLSCDDVKNIADLSKVEFRFHNNKDYANYANYISYAAQKNTDDWDIFIDKNENICGNPAKKLVIKIDEK